ncbi:MAG: asparagine synthase (glutamine-hydrolyzing) [Phycisphaeraceae bacterium]|nr:MAG: asparagine synthase (glutamine-hydrolyzing) [Phycisphaeraceae bacterium]
MCGIVGLITPDGERPAGDARLWERMRDRLAHRGPDGAGLLDLGSVVLAHRRLAVIDPGEGGAQPMRGPGAGIAGPQACAAGRFAVVYNGELYNDAELRRELGTLGWVFRSASDTETVLASFWAWGVEALHRFRGMYALAVADTERQRVVLARDPLGIKPLCWWSGEVGGVSHVIFASEASAILEHPAVPRRPDMAVVAGYLATIRTTLGERTLYRDIRTLTPGRALVIDQARGKIDERDWWKDRVRRGWVRGFVAMDDAGVMGGLVRAAVEDSVTRHLRSDVPLCALLSGGLDSTIVSTLASRGEGGGDGKLATYCAGAEGGEDFVHAREVAGLIGSDHHEAVLTRGEFRERWAWMVSSLGTPLSTPNEVAINAVARALRSRGDVVALSGEGADELFGGYDLALRAAVRGAAGEGVQGWTAYLAANTWIGLGDLSDVLRPDATRGEDAADTIAEAYQWEFEEADEMRRELGHREIAQTFQFLLRRVNLEGLLRRLDTAMMLEGVEGRTPLADAAVCEVADALPLFEKIDLSREGDPTATKIVLRRVFRDLVPASVRARAKASFPLPFQAWAGDRLDDIESSAFGREVFTRRAIEAVRADPIGRWNLLWPMANLGMWGRVF